MNRFSIEQDRDFCQGPSDTGESRTRRLLAEVIWSAIDALYAPLQIHYGDGKRRVIHGQDARDALNWFDGSIPTPLSFATVCEFLEINKDHALERVARIIKARNRLRNDLIWQRSEWAKGFKRRECGRRSQSLIHVPVADLIQPDLRRKAGRVHRGEDKRRARICAASIRRAVA